MYEKTQPDYENKPVKHLLDLARERLERARGPVCETAIHDAIEFVIYAIDRLARLSSLSMQ